MDRTARRFALIFLVSIGLFSLVFQFDVVDRRVIIPFTGIVAHASNAIMNMMGMRTHVSGTVISGMEGFSVNILNGCNGVYVIAIVVSAVLAFPSTWKEKALGILLGFVGVQIINVVRIISLYYIGLNEPALFEQFHYYVWQTGVIILSMALWIFWAEVLVKGPARSR